MTLHRVAPPLLRAAPPPPPVLHAALPPLSPLPDDESLIPSALDNNCYIDHDDYIDDIDGYIDLSCYDYIDDGDSVYIHIIDDRTTSRSSMARMKRSNVRPTVEPPLTECEKVRARIMMRNNRMLQSLGMGLIASMIRKTNEVQEGRTNEVQEGSGVINDDPEYNPKEDEVIDGEEMDDGVVHKTVKALKESRMKRPGVKKSSETSRAMPPGRKEERNGEELSAIEFFKATHNNKKHGFSELDKIAIFSTNISEFVVAIFCIFHDMMKIDLNVSLMIGSLEKPYYIEPPYCSNCMSPDHISEERKFDAEIVKEVLKTEVKQSTFLRNVGLQSSKYISGKATAAVASHVCDLEQKLERSELKAEVMQEEMAAIKMKEEEYEVACDKELELLRKKSQEQEEKLAHLMALFGAKAS
ncbi:hypothetical protein D1007_36136 [Hordeum vulgare]|nr:hypothetical protein D1007_36136 [Hordeum vulgare]